MKEFLIVERSERLYLEIGTYLVFTMYWVLTHLSLSSLLLDIGKQHGPRCEASERGVLSGAILFAYRNFVRKWNKILKSHLQPLKMKVDSPK